MIAVAVIFGSTSPWEVALRSVATHPRTGSGNVRGGWHAPLRRPVRAVCNVCTVTEFPPIGFIHFNHPATAFRNHDIGGEDEPPPATGHIPNDNATLGGIPPSLAEVRHTKRATVRRLQTPAIPLPWRICCRSTC